MSMHPEATSIRINRTATAFAESFIYSLPNVPRQVSLAGGAGGAQAEQSEGAMSAPLPADSVPERVAKEGTARNTERPAISWTSLFGRF